MIFFFFFLKGKLLATVWNVQKQKFIRLFHNNVNYKPQIQERPGSTEDLL